MKWKTGLLIIVLIGMILIILDFALQTYVAANFFTRTLVPAASNIWFGVTAAIAAQPLWYILVIPLTAILFLILGITIMHFKYKADWSIRRWAQNRTSRDLGVPQVTQFPSTPVAQTPTTRPVQQVAPAPTPVTPASPAPVEEKKEET